MPAKIQFLDRLRELNSRPAWPTSYTSARSGKVYQPHNDEEAVFVYDDVPRASLLRGGWGGGKSVAGIIKTLERIRRGMNGIVVSPDFEHFKVSLWPVFRDWCPWDMVIAKHQYRQVNEWSPPGTFVHVFRNGAMLYCGGIKDASRWFGGNVHFALFDEAARYPDASALKTLLSRARLSGPNDEPPQVFITTTPAKNWLYDYFGPLKDDDPLASFKADTYVGTVRTAENLDNLDPEYAATQRASLTTIEASQYLDAEWIDLSDTEKFVNLIWWDNCREPLAPMTRSEPMVLAMDAAKGGETSTPDCFAVIGVTRHPTRREDVAVRFCGVWTPPAGGLLDFAPIEVELRRLCREFSVVEVAYDPYQLHDMAMRLKHEGIANFREFGQGAPRLLADKQLQDIIVARRVAHDGNPLLRKHVDNANIKKSGPDGIRLIKKTDSMKIDAAVALSMACSRVLHYNLA